MSSLFGGKQKPMPAVPPPAAIPVVGPDTEDSAMKSAKQRAGYQKTIITGDLTPNTGKKRLLGG